MPANPNQTYIQELSPLEQRQYSLDMTGDPSDVIRIELPDGAEVSVASEGCLASVRDELFGSLQTFAEWHATAIYFSQLIPGTVLSDSHVKTALEKWQSCMVAESFPRFDNPDEAFSFAHHYFDDFDAATARQHELELAVADAECAASADLRAAGDTALLRLERTINDEWQKRIGHIQTMLHEAVGRASSIVSSDAGGIQTTPVPLARLLGSGPIALAELMTGAHITRRSTVNDQPVRRFVGTG